jgi:hypothetical protein
MYHIVNKIITEIQQRNNKGHREGLKVMDVYYLDYGTGFLGVCMCQTSAYIHDKYVHFCKSIINKIKY